MSTSTSTSWTSLFKQIASFNGDLSAITAPPFILSPTSVIEYSQFWVPSVDLFLGPSLSTDPEDRAVRVLRWFVATLRGHYSSRSEAAGMEKKPLNPFLGERFEGRWPDTGHGHGPVTLCAEQVSHHPPVTAYAVGNTALEITCQGYNRARATFASGAIVVKQHGHALLRLGKHDETYLITLPDLHLEGIVYGAPYIELEGQSYITSSSGYKAVIEYSGKGYFSGRKNSYKATLTGPTGNVVIQAAGQWNQVSRVTGGTRADAEEPVFLDMARVSSELQVADLADQDVLESRRAWHKVAQAIRDGDYEAISREKGEIEQKQRELRQAEHAEGRQWRHKWFRQVCNGDDPEYVELCKKAGVNAGGVYPSSSAAKEVDLAQTNWRLKVGEAEEAVG